MFRLKSQQSGFTLVEVTVGVILIAIIATTFWTFSNTSISQYLALQENSSVFGDLANKTQRVAAVVRGLTDISSASTNELRIYAYFFPNDTYVSDVRYYLNPAQTTLYADVTPMSANPPIGTPLTSEMKTYTIIENYYSQPGVNLFEYTDVGGADLTPPISDLDTVKNIQVNLAVPPGTGSASANAQTMSLVVSLRNRKTNL